MKGKSRTAVIVLAVLLLAAVQGVVVSQIAADGGLVLWKQSCPGYADLSFVPEAGTMHVVCSMADLHNDYTR